MFAARCDTETVRRRFFGSTAIRLSSAIAVPGILTACIPDSVLIAVSESAPLPPGARSAGQTSIPSDGSVPRLSVNASRVDSRSAGVRALDQRHETGSARRPGRASDLPCPSRDRTAVRPRMCPHVGSSRVGGVSGAAVTRCRRRSRRRWPRSAPAARRSVGRGHAGTGRRPTS